MDAGLGAVGGARRQLNAQTGRAAPLTPPAHAHDTPTPRTRFPASAARPAEGTGTHPPPQGRTGPAPPPPPRFPGAPESPGEGREPPPPPQARPGPANPRPGGGVPVPSAGLAALA